MKKISNALSSVLAVVFLLEAHVSAQTITALNPTNPTVSNSLPASGGPSGSFGTGGYDLFYVTPIAANGSPTDPSSNLVSLPSYVTGLTTDSSLQPYNASSSAITVSGTTYTSGLLYSPTYDVTAADPQTFVTFELTGNVPSGFNVGVLQDYPDNSLYTLSLYSGVPSDSTLLQSTAISDGTKDSSSLNEFYFGEVSGATAGDYLVISAAPQSGHNQVTIGGITFDTNVPEPSTYALLLTGFGILLFLARRRRA